MNTVKNVKVLSPCWQLKPAPPALPLCSCLIKKNMSLMPHLKNALNKRAWEAVIPHFTVRSAHTMFSSWGWQRTLSILQHNWRDVKIKNESFDVINAPFTSIFSCSTKLIDEIQTLPKFNPLTNKHWIYIIYLYWLLQLAVVELRSNRSPWKIIFVSLARMIFSILVTLQSKNTTSATPALTGWCILTGLSAEIKRSSIDTKICFT